MLVLGIDPGVALTGFGVIEEKNKCLNLISIGCIKTSSKDIIQKRLKTISSSVKDLIIKHNPSEIAIERLFFSTNSKTAIKVGEARGVILLMAQEMGINVFEYTPLEVKQALTGYGRADKKQIQYMVKKLLHNENLPKVDDASDAAAIAICHINSRRLKALK